MTGSDETRQAAVDEETTAASAAPPGPSTRRRPGGLPVALGVVAVLLAVAVVVAITTSGQSRETGPPTTERAGLPGGCPTPVTAVRSPTVRAVGTWPARALVAGDFVGVSAGAPGRVLALQACGAEESWLRVVDVDLATGAGTASAPIPGAAPLASSLAVEDGTVAVGVGRLALTKATDSPPYRLSLLLLGGSDLALTRTVALGRGYGLEVRPGPDGELVVSTGSAIDLVDSAGGVRRLASFPGLVLQQLVVSTSSQVALVVAFRPDAVPPASSSTLELISLRTGALEHAVALPAGTSVTSLALAGAVGAATLDLGGSYTVARYSLSSGLAALAKGHGGVPATLTASSLSAAFGTLSVLSASLVACVDLATGTELATAGTPTASTAPTALVDAGGRAVALLPGGLALLTLPASCRR